jgi:orotate phosphoribosyltransferase-like protein
MRKKPSRKMLRARAMRKKGCTLDEIGKELKVTKQGARWLLGRADELCGMPHLGTYWAFKRFLNEGKKGIRSS